MFPFKTQFLLTLLILLKNLVRVVSFFRAKAVAKASQNEADKIPATPQLNFLEILFNSAYIFLAI